jgi:hypothetical protein
VRNTSSTFAWAGHRFARHGIGGSFTLIACVALVTSLPAAAKADPIMGNISLTIAPPPGLSGFGGSAFSNAPVVYSSGTVDLSQEFQSQIQPGGIVTDNFINLTGRHLYPDFGGLPVQMNTTFQMQITFDGAAGSQPTIDVTGKMNVDAAGTPEGTFNTGAYAVSSGTPQSATVQGWTPDSGIPMSLINQYLNTSNYYLWQQDNFSYGSTPGQDTPSTGTFTLIANASAITPVPEPGAVLVYLAAFGALGFRHIARRRRSGRS